jgi:hypothetical protein
MSTPAVREVIYTEFAKQLHARLEAEAREARAISSRRNELREEKARLEKQMDELLATIKDVGRSPRLSREWKDLEARVETLDEQLGRQDMPEARRFDARKLREFVDKEAENFAAVLTADRVEAWEQIRRHVGKIMLTPRVTDSGQFYEVSGDVALFSVDESSLQLDKEELIELQCTFPLRLSVDASRPWRRRGTQVSAERSNHQERGSSCAA